MVEGIFEVINNNKNNIDCYINMQDRKDSNERRESIQRKRNKFKQINDEKPLELNDFFHRTDDQIKRITFHQITNNISENKCLLKKSPKLNGEDITLADICSLASNVARKMSLNKQKINLDATRGFRFPSTTYGQEYSPRRRSSSRSSPIRLIDLLPKTSYPNEYKQRLSTPSTTLSKTNVQFIQQRQNSTFNLTSLKPIHDINIQNLTNIDGLNKTIKETLLIGSVPFTSQRHHFIHDKHSKEF